MLISKPFTYILIFIVGGFIGTVLDHFVRKIPIRVSLFSGDMIPAICRDCSGSQGFSRSIPLIWPLFGFGLCRWCGSALSLKRSLIELITALLTCLTTFKFGFTPHSLFALIFIYSLIVVTFIDLEHQIIPDEISLGGIVYALLISNFNSIGIIESLGSVILGGGIFFLIASIFPGGMGGGDVKLMGAIAGFLGYKGLLITIVASSFAGSFFGLISMLVAGKAAKSRIPFGPFLAFGAILSIFFKDLIVDLYLRFLLGDILI